MNKKKLFLIIIGILVLSALVFGGTFAYLSWVSSDDQKTMVTFTATPEFSCSADVSSISSGDTSLAPTDCTDSEHAIKREITVNTTINGNDPVYLNMNLRVNSIDSELSNSENFRYAITTGDNSCNDGVITSSKFNGISANDEVNLLSNVVNNTTNTKTYYLWIWLDAAETNNNTQNKNFNLSITGSCSNHVSTISLPTQITDEAVMDNIRSTYVTNNNGIRFNAISSDTNGKGVYIRSGTENDPHPIYYYRGAVTNNNVLFANFCWKIVRTTDTGGVKLIYNGTPSSGKCTNTTGTATQLASTSAFKSNYNSPAYVGYMYGTVYTSLSKAMKNITEVYQYGKSFTYSNGTYTLSNTKSFAGTDWASNYNKLNNNHYTCLSTGTTCSSIYYIFYTNSSYAYYITLTGGKSVEDALAEMLTNSSNTINSNIKTAVDNWYSTNMTSYTNKLEDTVWCNDRTIYQLNGWNPNGGDTTKYLYFGGYSRAYSTYSPSLSCNKNDAFTKENVAIGNGKLTYPVGLITADEIMLGGGKTGANNSTYYLYTNKTYWSGSPSSYDNYAFGFFVYYSGYLNYRNVYNSYGVRPAVSLKPGVRFASGDGTSDTPYVVE